MGRKQSVEEKSVTGQMVEVSQGNMLHFVVFVGKLKGKMVEQYNLVYRSLGCCIEVEYERARQEAESRQI